MERVNLYQKRLENVNEKRSVIYGMECVWLEQDVIRKRNQYNNKKIIKLSYLSTMIYQTFMSSIYIFLIEILIL